MSVCPQHLLIAHTAHFLVCCRVNIRVRRKDVIADVLLDSLFQKQFADAVTKHTEDNEAALIGGLISNYFFQPSVDAKLRESYRRVLRHLHENTLSASDLSRIQNALTFLSPLCRDTREAHKDMMGVTLKTDALLRANR